MFSPKKEKPDVVTKKTREELSKSKVQAILRTVSPEKAFYFYEGLRKPTGHVATSLVDFRNKINSVESESLAFHLKRKDFWNWIKIVIGDSELATRISNISAQAFDFRNRLYTMVSARIKELSKILSITKMDSEEIAPYPPKITQLKQDTIR
ncbi:MAG: DUF5752 family protein [Candidatus Bathyarchaeota archaeon]|jgi:hypothetical protein